MRILLTGRDGQVGHELARSLAPLGELIALDRRALDLSDPDSIRARVREHRPDWIVNAAAYTAVDRAESEEALALAINAAAPGVLAEEARRIGAGLLHYSTDYVFDGAQAGPYVEDDAPNPRNAYGRSKRAGEDAVRAAGAAHLILRTSWVYGLRGRNFLRTILRLAGERDELKIVDDQFGAPTWSRLIAESSALLLARLGGDRDAWQALSGIYHLSAGGRTSWHGFARAILEYVPAERRPRLTPIPGADYPTPARRPANSVLANDKLQAAFGLRMPSWEAGLALCMEEAGDTL